jgi:hypothetical protein
MVKNTSSRGRPKAIYFPKLGGDPVVGLMRLGDGRWRASGPEKYTFTEPDEKLAIVQFREWEVRQLGSNLGTLKVHTGVHMTRCATWRNARWTPAARCRQPSNPAQKVLGLGGG